MATAENRDKMGLGALAAVLAGALGYVLLGTAWGGPKASRWATSTTKSSSVAPCSKTAF